MKDNRSRRLKEKYPYSTVQYVCPGCGAVASQTWTKAMNEKFLELIDGTFCPDCEEKIIDRHTRIPISRQSATSD